MRTRVELAGLMGAKDREVDDVTEVDGGQVVTIRGYRTLVREDGSMVHSVGEPVEVSPVAAQRAPIRTTAHVGEPVKKTAAKKA